MRSMSAFCPTCGHSVGADPGDTPAVRALPPAGTPAPVKKRPAAVVAGVVVVLAALGAGAFLAQRPTPAQLAITVIPEMRFHLRVSKTADGEPREFAGDQPIALRPGDYFLDVVPVDRGFQRKRLKVHLSPGQTLALPVVLAPAGPSSARP